MRRFRGHRRAAEQDTEINLSPLIDMVFILLIFFIVTTVFVKESGISVNRPKAASAVELERQSILIGVDAGGRVFYSGQEIGVQGVRAVVRRLIEREEMPVIIQADKAVPTGVTARVMDEAKLGGASAINLATLAPNAS
mgnify:CR=1 FL=1